VSRRIVTKEKSAGLYGTPRWPVTSLLSATNCVCCGAPAPRLPGGRWLEPCAGEGSICYAANELRVDVSWTAVERDKGLFSRYLQPAFDRGELARVVHADFFEWIKTDRERFAVAPMNPAFPDAERFVRECLHVALWTVALERLDWLSGEDRVAFYRDVGEPDVWVLPNRPSFRGRGQDSGDYAWFVWGPGVNGRVHHLRGVPLSQRQEHRLQTRMENL